MRITGYAQLSAALAAVRDVLTDGTPTTLIARPMGDQLLQVVYAGATWVFLLDGGAAYLCYQSVGDGIYLPYGYGCDPSGLALPADLDPDDAMLNLPTLPELVAAMAATYLAGQRTEAVAA